MKNKNSLTHLESKHTFITNEGKIYDVAFEGTHSDMRAKVFRNGIYQSTYNVDYGHATKTRAKQILTYHIKNN